MAKFKVGDRIVRTTTGLNVEIGDRGVIVSIPDDREALRVKYDHLENSCGCFPENAELEEIWDSPLYKAMKEDDV